MALKTVAVIQEPSGFRAGLLETIGRVDGVIGEALVPESDNRETVRKLEDLHAGLVFIDAFLPTKGGSLDLLERVLKSPLEPRVIFLTTLADEKTGRLAQEKGAWDVIVQPQETGRAESLVQLWRRLGGAEKKI